jgi:DNA-binding MltR family transcriptional regulator
MTDESTLYVDAHHFVSTHDSVKHSAEEYVRGDVHTNTIEAISQCSSAGCAASISIAPRSIHNGI